MKGESPNWNCGPYDKVLNTHREFKPTDDWQALFGKEFWIGDSKKPERVKTITLIYQGKHDEGSLRFNETGYESGMSAYYLLCNAVLKGHQPFGVKK